MTSHFVIAIDGPAASGKGTIGRLLAEYYQLPHLDTGLTYRAVANELLKERVPLEDESQAERTARALDLGAMDRSVLSSHQIGAAASKVAVMSGVRSILVEQQRKFAATSPGAVLDGRDIGTVVCPDADVKFYITASAAVRADRRWKETTRKGDEARYEDILADIEERDARDMSREDSPLKPADNAHLIDTSEMSIETAFQACVDIVEQYRHREM